MISARFLQNLDGSVPFPFPLPQVSYTGLSLHLMSRKYLMERESGIPFPSRQIVKTAVFKQWREI